MYIRLIISVIGLMLFAACTNPVGDDEHEVIEAKGLALMDGQQELLRVQNAQASDTLAVPLDGATPVIDVVFLDEEGQPIHEEDFGEEYSLQWSITNPQVVSLESEGRWGFTAHGESAGETGMLLQLAHGDHADFSAPITVRVE